MYVHVHMWCGGATDTANDGDVDGGGGGGGCGGGGGGGGYNDDTCERHKTTRSHLLVLRKVLHAAVMQ